MSAPGLLPSALALLPPLPRLLALLAAAPEPPRLLVVHIQWLRLQLALALAQLVYQPQARPSPSAPHSLPSLLAWQPAPLLTCRCHCPVRSPKQGFWRLAA